MGFRCLFCKKDFGRNKEQFNIHIEKEHGGVVQTLKEEIDKSLLKAIGKKENTNEA